MPSQNRHNWFLGHQKKQRSRPSFEERIRLHPGDFIRTEIIANCRLLGDGGRRGASASRPTLSTFIKSMNRGSSGGLALKFDKCPVADKAEASGGATERVPAVYLG
jgi:hypothetical protein